MATPTYITPDELVARLGGHVAKKTLANWRSDPRGMGPPFSRFGNRILYSLAGVIAWEEGRQYTTTKDYGKKPVAA